MIKELYVIRHGIADEASEHSGIDEERQLTEKGAEKVRGVAQYLRSRDVELGVVVSSPLARARETAELVAAVCCCSRPLVITDLLLPEGSHEELIAFLNGLSEETLAVVGHEPFLSGFVSYCLANSSRPFVRMKKAGVACILYDNQIEAGACELAWLMGPGQMLSEK